MELRTLKWVKPEDLNANQTLFGGRLLHWIDEEAALYAIIQLSSRSLVTKYMSEINFISAPRQGDIVEIVLTVSKFGVTSVTLACEVKNKITNQMILTIEKIVFVNLDRDGRPLPHGKNKISDIDNYNLNTTKL